MDISASLTTLKIVTITRLMDITEKMNLRIVYPNDCTYPMMSLICRQKEMCPATEPWTALCSHDTKARNGLVVRRKRAQRWSEYGSRHDRLENMMARMKSIHHGDAIR